jgi:serine/threonine protein kinase
MNAATVSNDIISLTDYDMLGKIAEGSMAAVYRGRRREDGLAVAIKVPHRHILGNDVLRERFLREYRVGKEIDHPNVVRALDCFEEDGSYYLVMELVEGHDLWQHIVSKGRLPEAEAIDIIVQIANGLHEVHKHGIIHRDIKPDNILLTAGGTPKLADLGLSKDLEDELGLTAPARGLGTPVFTAPEQFTDACHADVRCDVYSLGATLYAAVTGVVPFATSKLSAILTKKLQNDLVPPRKIVPSLSESVDWAIRRAVQADPRRRPASCAELCRLLRGGESTEIFTAESHRRAARLADERRRAVRYPCALSTVCEVVTTIHPSRGSSADRWNGEVLDVSVGGVGLLLDRRFERGTVVGLVLESKDRKIRRQVEMRVVRVTRDRNQPWFIAGAFGSPLDRSELHKLLP